MAEIQDYSTTAASNNSASPDGMPENMAPSGVNNSWREGIARTKRWYDDISGVVTSAGSASAYTLAAARTISAYAAGQCFLFEANHASTGAATLNVDSVGAKAIVKNYDTPLVANDIVAGQMVYVVYEATADNFQMISPVGYDFAASAKNVRWLTFNLVEAGTDCATATNIAGDFVSPIAGTILQSDSSPYYLFATNSTAGTHTTTGMVVDINIGGTSIMTTNKIDFATGVKNSYTTSTQPDLTTTALAVGDIITIDIDSIADGTAAKGLTVYMAVRET